MTIFAIDPRTLGRSYQEAKEGVADALINMTVARCSGEGRLGEFVFGRLPQRAFVSGHLLPRYDQTGEVDETDDIHTAMVSSATFRLRIPMQYRGGAACRAAPAAVLQSVIG
jgi:hypothetical protein